LQSYVLVWQEESLIQLLKNLWRHVNYVGNSYYLPSDKGYERILWKLMGYECVERLRTIDLDDQQLLLSSGVILSMLVMCKTDSVMRYCVAMANHFLCSCVYDRVCMDHESAINYCYYKVKAARSISTLLTLAVTDTGY